MFPVFAARFWGGVIVAFAAVSACGTWAASVQELWEAARAKAGSYEVHGRHRLEEGKPEYVNALILESSPYLLQHAHQPVEWRSWSDAVRAEAQAARRPIFLSIGYATCHWCQVMARESFDDLGIARLLNRHFVSIKVDREERPELDSFYLERLELLTGSPGWPANFVLTPEGKVIAAVSYLKRDALAEFLSRYARAWAESPAALHARAQKVEQRLARAPRAAATDLAAAAKTTRLHLLASFDPQFPGFGGEPRFFFAQHLQRHLASWRATGDAEDLRRFLLPLQALVRSGTHDWVSGGVFRYSVSRDWNRPHFEKLLIDQALLLPLFAEAWTISGEAAYRDAARGLIRLVRDSWTQPDGLLAAGQDASKDGGEGSYYLYSGAERAALASSPGFSAEPLAWQAIHPDGALPLPPADPAKLAQLRKELTQKRAMKPAPPLDRKVITAWNAAFFAAASQAAPLLGDTELAAWATLGMQRLLAQNRPSGQIKRYSLQGKAQGQASLEDHAYLLLALARLYEADGAEVWLETAEAWAQEWRTPRALLEMLRNSAADRGAPSAAAVWVQAAVQLAANPRTPRLQALLAALRPELARLAAAAPESHAALVASLTTRASAIPDRFAYLADGQVEARLRPIARLEAPTLELELRIRKGWHINSATPRQNYLRPTQLVLAAGAGGKLGMSCPAGEDQTLGDETLSLYSGVVELRGTLDAPPRTHSPLELRIQACNDEVCLAPEKVVLHP